MMRPVLVVLAGVLLLTGCPGNPGEAPPVQEKGGRAMQSRARALSPTQSVPMPGPDMRTIVANARVSKSGTAMAARPAGAARDVNLDARSDIVWYNVNSGELYYWLLGPAGVVGENGGTHLPIGHTALGTGDFDGDGRPDVVSASSAEVRITFARGWTFGDSRHVAARPPRVWTLAGIADINGDGRSDLVWHHRGSGELYYWLMDAASIFAGQGGAYLPGGYVALGGGDFDGDGRGDILSASPTEVRISFGPRAGAGWTYSRPTARKCGFRWRGRMAGLPQACAWPTARKRSGCSAGSAISMPTAVLTCCGSTPKRRRSTAG